MPTSNILILVIAAIIKLFLVISNASVLRQTFYSSFKVHSLGIGLEEESQRSLAMEAELERYLVQINGQAEELAAARATRQDLEEALRRARADSEHFKKQLTEAHRVAMSQATVAASLVTVMPNNPAQAFR